MHYRLARRAGHLAAPGRPLLIYELWWPYARKDGIYIHLCISRGTENVATCIGRRRCVYPLFFFICMWCLQSAHMGQINKYSIWIAYERVKTSIYVRFSQALMRFDKSVTFKCQFLGSGGLWSTAPLYTEVVALHRSTYTDYYIFRWS